MKLRIRNNAVRIRVDRDEVARLAAGEAVQQTTAFGPTQRLVCTVLVADGDALRATFHHQAIVLHVPRDQLRGWATSDAVAITASQPIVGEAELILLLEKDFECLHDARDAEANAFPHPAKRRVADA